MDNLKNLIARQIELSALITNHLTNGDSEIDPYLILLLKENMESSKDLAITLSENFLIDDLPKELRSLCNSRIDDLETLAGYFAKKDLARSRHAFRQNFRKFCEKDTKRFSQYIYDELGLDYDKQRIRSKTVTVTQHPHSEPYNYDLFDLLSPTIDQASDQDLQDLADQWMNIKNLKHYVPLEYGVEYIRTIDRPFWFVHYTEEGNAYDIITTKDLLGREKPVLSSNVTKPPLIKNDGYLYAYTLDISAATDDPYDAVDEFLASIKRWEAKAKHHRFWNKGRSTWEYDSESEDYKKNHRFPYAFSIPVGYPTIFGIATKGVEVFSRLDNQKQTIIPVSCIQRNSLFLDLSLYEVYGPPYTELWTFDMFKKMAEMQKGGQLDWDRSRFQAYSLGVPLNKKIR